MKRLQAYNVEIEANPHGDLAVDQAIVERDMAAIQGSDWERQDEALDMTDPLVQSLVQWLGRDAVEKLRSDSFHALRRSIAMLPDPVEQTSFAWDAIRGASDIMKVAEAIVAYRQFDEGALVLADAMGANHEFRAVMKAASVPDDLPLTDFLSRERAVVDRIDAFNGRLGDLMPFMEAMFGGEEFSVGAAVVAVAAAKGLSRGLPRLSDGFRISKAVDDEILGNLEFFREHMVAAAQKVEKACRISPLRYALSVLSGVRRSLAPGTAGDFRYAVRAIGGSIESEEDLKAAASAFAEYLKNVDDFNHTVGAAGFELDEVPQLLGHIQVRRHLMSSAQSVGVPWGDVSRELSIRPDARTEILSDLLAHVKDDGITGRLKAVAKGYTKKVANVLEVGQHYVTVRRYWMDAGDRVAGLDPEIAVGDLKELVRIEPQIGHAKELLKSYGATSRADIDTLERHLEWMTSAYALPVEDSAFDAIIATKAEVIPLRLSQQA